MLMNLIAQFLEMSHNHPDKIAVVDGHGRHITFGELEQQSSGLAKVWQSRGIEKGVRVLLAMPVGIDLYASIAALWRLGATIVFPEPAMGFSGVRHAVTLSQPTAVLTSGLYKVLPYIVPELWNVPIKLHLSSASSASNLLEDVTGDHPALISFTSGSTGKPKGMVRSHKFLSAQNACVGQLLKSQDEEIDLVAFPVFVIANLGLGVTSLLPNWKLTRHDQANPLKITRYIKEAGVTRALIPPSICQLLSETNVDPGLKAIFTGGGPIFPDLMKKLLKEMPNTSIMAVYGSTEAEPISHLHINEINEKNWRAMETGSGLLAGKPIAETRTRILNDEIVVTGEHVNKSYLNGVGDDENKVKINGEIWHRTGDAGKLDEDGNLWLRGRWSAKADHYFPFDLEVAARCWPGVINAALIPGSNPPCLAIMGDKNYLEGWNIKAKQMGDILVKHVTKIPLDKRHRSKVDYNQLEQMLK